MPVPSKENLEKPSKFSVPLASEHESLVFTVEFKVGINKYIKGLRNRPQNINNLADLIRFGNENKELLDPTTPTNLSESARFYWIGLSPLTLLCRRVL
ncbi:hypothetical protein HD554DRAFT_2173155 [Boletus coccyginus]|nr:hypothetical protein HD554DRAFT_2173155 [Boletus coccyginus]